MGILIFTPWYCIVDRATIGRYVLEPFFMSVENQNVETTDQTAKVILKNYLTQPYTSSHHSTGVGENTIKHATLITITRGNHNQEEIQTLQSVISFAGISDREFTDSNLYLCTDNFKIITQMFPDPIPTPFDPSISIYTKYGPYLNGFIGNVFREVKPWHITNQTLFSNRNYRLKFNEPLAQCLWKFKTSIGQKQKVWRKNLFPALFSFHNGNTDGQSMQIDCIYSEAAIERLFLGEGHKEERLVQEVLSFLNTKGIVFEPYQTTNRNWQSIKYKDQNLNEIPCASIFEAWLRELVRLRNRYAHGGRDAQAPSVWSLTEHLLLSSFLFPLLIKLYVSQYDNDIQYTFPRGDRNKLRAYEQLLAEVNYFDYTAPHNGITQWGSILSNARSLP